MYINSQLSEWPQERITIPFVTLQLRKLRHKKFNDLPKAIQLEGDSWDLKPGGLNLESLPSPPQDMPGERLPRGSCALRRDECSLE